MNDNSQSYTEHYMVSLEQAFSLIKENSQLLPTETVSLKYCHGRILAEDIYSPVSIPPFNNSAMDGYAICNFDVNSATTESPITLTLAGLTAAGDPKSNTSAITGTAWKIMTGAPVPSGYDTIVPVENTQFNQETNEVTFTASAKEGVHIRLSGEDFAKGNLVLRSQTLINPNRIMALASLGHADILVRTQPVIAVFSTGKELVDDPNQPLENGQIRNSNMPYILESLRELPVQAHNAGTNYDDVEQYQIALQKELDNGANIIISTGAVSMGDFDFIPQTIKKMGGTILFHKAKIKPGKPILFARFPNGTYYFGLPGNPISATIGLRFFVSHLINLMLGMKQETPIHARLNQGRNKKKGFTNILKANATINNNAVLTASILQGQESFKIHPMIDANGWAILEGDKESYADDSLIEFYPSALNLNR
ncbi:MAG: molybdopterin molybdotransferase MoeA [Kangiellaceae bacterium]|nr:molybdopterin molybdotransferase MoeA [Kangiellaceae bacterium]